MFNWVVYLIISGGCWGLSDTLCDVVIGHTEKKKDHKVEDYELVNTSMNNNKISDDNHKQNNINKDKQQHQQKNLTANQTVFLSVFTTYILIVLYVIWIILIRNTYMSKINYESFIFREKYDHVFYLALSSGIFCYLSYHFMMQAFETSSSTIILPLLQFPSIFTLFGSSIIRIYLDQPWIESYWHLLAYFLVFCGGLLPATNGNLQQILTKNFWKQPFVKYAIFSEFNHGLYNLLISTANTNKDINTGESSILHHMEYFAVTRIFYILTFVIALILSKRYQEDLINLRFAKKRHIIWTIISEILAFCGYFSSAIAYQAYYQTGIVAASETSLNQLLNLTFAYVLMKYFNIGKKASTTGIKGKVLSTLLIMIGLLLANGGH